MDAKDLIMPGVVAPEAPEPKSPWRNRHERRKIAKFTKSARWVRINRNATNAAVRKLNRLAAERRAARAYCADGED